MRRPLWYGLGILGVLLVSGSAAAAATGVVHGKGELVSQPLTGDLEVIDARVEPLLLPGGSSDLVLQVRNRSAYAVVADRVGLQLPLRDAKPAGCAAKVSGPLLGRDGVTLVDAQRVVIGAGRAAQVVVPDGLSLAAGARGGCGFRVIVDVQALRVVATTPPPTTAPTTAPTTPATTPPTTEPTSPPATPTPTTSQPDDCDPVDPTCNGTTIVTVADDPPKTPPTPTPPPLDCDPVDPACTQE